MLGELEGQPRLVEHLAAVGGHVEVDLVLVVLVDHRDEEKLLEEEEAVAARGSVYFVLPRSSERIIDALFDHTPNGWLPVWCSYATISSVSFWKPSLSAAPSAVAGAHSN